MNLYNAEGYIDLTAYEALSRIEREERRAKKAAAYRPLVYICSPYSHGCINDNIENARRYSRFAVDTHYVPIAPHLLFPQFMDDSLGEDRQTAMFMNLVLLSKCAQLWVFGSVRSEPIGKAMTGLAISSMSVVKWIKAIRKSPENYIGTIVNTVLKMVSLFAAHQISILLWNRLGTNVRGQQSAMLLLDFASNSISLTKSMFLTSTI